MAFAFAYGSKGSSDNYGNILFVSVDGNDATAEKGDILKPYRTIEAAVSDWIAGDFIWVFSGDYPSPAITTSWYKPGIRIHFEDVTVNVATPFVFDQAGTMTVTGSLKGAFWSSSTITFAQVLTGVSGIVWNYEAEHGGVLSLSGTIDNVKINANIKYGVIRPNTSSTAGAITNIDINCNTLKLDQNIINLTTFSQVTGTSGFRCNYQVNEWSATGFNFSEGMVWSMGNSVTPTDVEINIKIGKLYVNAPAQASNAGIFFGRAGALNTRSKVSVHCDQCYVNSTNFVALVGGFIHRIQGVQIQVTGNYFFQGGAKAHSPTANVTGGGSSSIWFRGNFIAFDANPLIVVSSQVNLDVRYTGVWRVTGAAPILSMTANANNRLIFQDAILINDGTVAAMQSTVPTTVFVAGAFQQQSSLLDADITLTRFYEYAVVAGGGLTSANEGLSVVGTTAQLGNLTPMSKDCQIVGDVGFDFAVANFDTAIIASTNQAEIQSTQINLNSSDVLIGSGGASTIDFAGNTIIFGSIELRQGTGSPEGVVTAPTGSLYSDTNGGSGVTLWVKESSPTPNTGWIAK